MPPKTRFLIELAEFLASHRGLVAQGPAWILNSLRLGQEAPDEIQALLAFVEQGLPHFIDEHDVQEAIVEAVRLQAERFEEEEPETSRRSRPPPSRCP